MTQHVGWPSEWKMDPKRYAEYNETSSKPEIARQIAVQLLADHIDLAGARGFDFGCGDDRFGQALASRGAVMSGCDINPDVLPKSASHWIGGVDSLDRIPVDSLDFFTERNVAVLLSAEERQQLFRAAHRVLKHGGLLLTATGNALMTPARRNPKNPLTYKVELKALGFDEVAQAFHNTRLPPILRLFSSEKWTNDAAWRAMLPRWWLLRRSTAYLSLSRKV